MTYPVKDFIVLGAGSAGLMTAILAKRYLKINSNVKIIKSKHIPILGVGEGTTNHIRLFFKYSGIDEKEFIVKSKATSKVGVLFEDWLYDGHNYVHDITNLHDSSEDNDHNPFWSNDDTPLGSALCAMFPELEEDISDYLNGKYSGDAYSYHFNNFAMNDYLISKCEEFGIEIVEDDINTIVKNSDGYIQSVIGDNKHSADFFFDCSGFSRVLIKSYEPEWRSYSDQLIVDRALFFPYSTAVPTLPLTRAKAMKYGWFWQAPTQDRTGNGYVYSSKHCTAQEALDEVREMGFDLPDETIKNVKSFDPGHYDQTWIKNMCAIGLTSSFFEPMEAPALSTGILQALFCLDYLHSYDTNDDLIQDKYNDIFNRMYTNSFEFIRLHYITGRDNTSFWKEYADMEVPKGLATKIKLWKKKFPSSIEQDLTNEVTLYGTINYLRIMTGLKLIEFTDYDSYIKNHNMQKTAQILLLKMQHQIRLTKAHAKDHNDVLNHWREVYEKA